MSIPVLTRKYSQKTCMQTKIDRRLSKNMCGTLTELQGSPAVGILGPADDCSEPVESDEVNVVELGVNHRSHEGSCNVAKVVEKENDSSDSNLVGEHRKKDESSRHEVMKQELVVLAVCLSSDGYYLEDRKEVDPQLTHIVNLQLNRDGLGGPVRISFIDLTAVAFSSDHGWEPGFILEQ
jgi:hypothetical protein